MDEVNTERVARLIESIEQDVRTLRQLVLGEHAANTLPHYPSDDESGDQAIEGIFDGEKMVDYSGKAYQVSPNYASKSKLVEGDPLKLYVTHDGKYFYKQLGPVPRRTLTAVVRPEGNHYVLDADDGTSYGVLTASVTYYMSMYNMHEGDHVTILLPEEGPATWGVIDNVL